MTLLTRINLWFCVTFVVCGASAVALLQSVLYDNARQNSVAQARLLMAAARAARDYTSSEVGPALDGHAQAHQDFFPQAIPAYAANRIFTALRAKEPAYSYREAALNPTNVGNRALAWEAEVIAYFAANSGADELVAEHQGELGRSLYLAKPIRIDDRSCLACHDRPEDAPSGMLGTYGSEHGFAWRLHETIGAQIVLVPLSAAIAGAERAVVVSVIAMVGLFVLSFAVLNAIVRRVVLSRLASLNRVAQSMSTGQLSDLTLDTRGSDEIAALSRSFERMQISVDRALELLRASGETSQLTG